MAMRITCPFCGPRSIEEWVYGEIPVVPDSIVDPDERDVDRAFFHDNTDGEVTEGWFHLYGCRRWVKVTRSTG